MTMPERILIVDDEPDMLVLLRMILMERTPYEPITTPNPLEVEQILREKKPALIISDYRMPGLNGLELLDRVKKQAPRLPFILISAYGNTKLAAEALKKGAFDFIDKPFRQEKILKAIEGALNSAGASGEISPREKRFWEDELFRVPYAQARERLLAWFPKEYARRILEKNAGDRSKTAQEAGWSEEELSRILGDPSDRTA
jgi:DNA-binding NtrC family response regulator